MLEFLSMRTGWGRLALRTPPAEQAMVSKSPENAKLSCAITNTKKSRLDGRNILVAHVHEVRSSVHRRKEQSLVRALEHRIVAFNLG